MKGEMRGDTKEIFNKVHELPALPLVVHRLLEVTGDRQSSAKDVTRVLSGDEALAGKVLRLVNSAFYGFSREVSTITRAVVMLGYQAIRQLAVSLGTFHTLKGQCGGLDRERFWDHAISCAAGAQIMASRLHCEVPEEAFLAGLMHDIGHLILSIVFPKEFAEMMNNSPHNVLKHEEEVIGISHTRAASILLEHWRLPDPLIRVVRFHHSAKLALPDKEPLLASIMLGDMLSRVNHFYPNEGPNDRPFSSLMQAAHITTAEYLAILEEMEGRIKAIKDFLRVNSPCPAAGADKAHESPGAEEPAIAIVGSDSDRVTWVQSLVQSFGYKAVPVDFSPSVSLDGALTKVSILDTQTITAAALKELRSSARRNNRSVILLRDELPEPSEKTPDADDGRVLPLAFSREDLAACLGKVQT